MSGPEREQEVMWGGNMQFNAFEAL
jgi:hypothetical protein